MKLSGCILITGAAKRIGRHLALYFATRAEAVAVHYHTSKAEAGAVVTEITARGGRAHAFSADLCDEAQSEALIPAVRKALGPVTCLINNASVFQKDNVHDSPKKIWDAHMGTHLRGPVLLAGAMAAHLPEGSEGNIINLTDALRGSHRISPHYLSYSISKLGLEYLTQALAIDLAPRIRVNAIAPGAVLPGDGEEEVFDRLLRASPLRAPCTPEAIGDTVAAILKTPCMTGQILHLDAGLRLKAGADAL